MQEASEPDSAVFDAMRKLMPVTAQVKYISQVEGIVDTALDFRPDVIFINAQVPTSSGQDVAKGMRDYADFKEVPIVLTSRMEQLDVETMFPEIGFAHHLQLPLKVTTLYECLTSILPSPLVTERNRVS